MQNFTLFIIIYYLQWNHLSLFRGNICIGFLKRLDSIFMLLDETVFSYRHIDQYIQFMCICPIDIYDLAIGGSPSQFRLYDALISILRHVTFTRSAMLRYLCHTLSMATCIAYEIRTVNGKRESDDVLHLSYF